MKILSRMLSRKIEPQQPPEIDEDRQALDDAGRVNPSRDPMFADRVKKKAIEPRAEEPEVAGSGWAEGGDDWSDDDWDDDEDWGDEDLDMDLEERRRTEDKKHLVSEIREAVVSVSKVGADEERTRPASQDFGRRARARSQLTAAAADDAEDRLLEKTETEMSNRETSRRRSALQHMKAAAAATKADRVLQHVASRDPSADPEEQSPYRDDLAKVVRPHSKSRPISRQVSRPAAPSAVWDQGAGDEDAALYAASTEGHLDDPSASVEDQLSAEEEIRLSRSAEDLTEEDFAEKGTGMRNAETSEFPSSRFVSEPSPQHPPEDDTKNAFDDFAEEDFADDDDDDFAPRPSSAVAEAIAYANAPDEEVDPQPESEVRQKIWEAADTEPQVQETVHVPPQPQTRPQPQAQPEQFVDVSTPVVAGRAGRSAGRVKTRLLGFQAEQGPNDVFAGDEAASDAGRGPAAPKVTFPAGWIVVIDGPGRGACFTLHGGVSQIGRGDDQAVRLDFGDTSISRNNHAAVAYDDEQGKFFLGHGGKSNLVRLNGNPVLSTEEMQNGDQIRIGETTLKFVALCGEDFTWAGGSGEDASNE